MEQAERSSFDTQLFSWEEWQADGPMTMQFSNIQLKVPVGEYAVGAKFPFAILMGEASLLVLVDEQEEQHAFDLKVSVGAAVELPAVDECGPECQHDHTH
jgi:hypothetical protein